MFTSYTVLLTSMLPVRESAQLSIWELRDLRKDRGVVIPTKVSRTH